jgi:hypothetical protein
MGNDAKEDRDRRSAANLQLPEAKIFVEVVRRARGDARALSGVQVAHDALGLPSSWMRERMAGRIRVKAVDLEILDRLLGIAKANPYHGTKSSTPTVKKEDSLNEELRMYRVAVRRMCRECVGGDDDADAVAIGCPDGRCPLRRVSPLPMSKNPIEHPDTW